MCIKYVYVAIRVWARRNIGRPLCDESVLIITLVRGTSRDAFADTYDKLSVYQQISFPNPAIFPLVCPRPSAENNATYTTGSLCSSIVVFPFLSRTSYVLCTRVHHRPWIPETVACTTPAMTAKGRTILLNKVDTANGNVGVRCLLVGINGIAFSFLSRRLW